MKMSNIKKSWLATKPIAHRGLHDINKPENSIPAFKAAVEHGYPIELDVQLCADDVLVVFHDYNIERMTGQNRMMKDVFSSELSSLMLADTDFSIPTLEQVLELVDGKVPLLIEIKNEGKAGKLEEIVCKHLKGYKGEFAIESFNPFSILAVKKKCPDFIVGQLSKKFKDKSFFKDVILANCWLNIITKPDFVAYRIEDIPNRVIKKAKSKGLLICGWTINNEKDLRKAVRYCDNYIFENIKP